MTDAVGGKIMIFINLQKKSCKTSAPNYVQCTFLDLVIYERNCLYRQNKKNDAMENMKYMVVMQRYMHLIFKFFFHFINMKHFICT